MQVTAPNPSESRFPAYGDKRVSGDFARETPDL